MRLKMPSAQSLTGRAVPTRRPSLRRRLARRAGSLAAASVMMLAGGQAAPITGQSVFNHAPGNVFGAGVAAPFLAKPTTSSLADEEPESALSAHVLTSADGSPVAMHRMVLP